MDDYSTTTLQESRNEWCARLINILTPLIIEGFKSIFEESIKLCKENDEIEKYLMTFQNFISRIPKWNSTIIEDEVKRIVDAMPLEIYRCCPIVSQFNPIVRRPILKCPPIVCRSFRNCELRVQHIPMGCAEQDQAE